MASECPICTDTGSPNGSVSALKCGHVFHTSCVNDWLQNGGAFITGTLVGECPVCRQRFTTPDIQKIYITFTGTKEPSDSETIPSAPPGKVSLPENPQNGVNCRLYVKFWDTSVTEEDLNKYISQFAKVRTLFVCRKPDGSGKGYGFVTVRDPADVQKVIDSCDGQFWRGHPLHIELARERNESAGNTLCREVFVTNLAMQVSDIDVRGHFQRFGGIAEVRIFPNKNNKPKKSASILFTKKDSAELAIREANLTYMCGNTIHVRQSRRQSQSRPGYFVAPHPVPRGGPTTEFNVTCAPTRGFNAPAGDLKEQPTSVPVYTRASEPRPAPTPVYARAPAPRPATTPVYARAPEPRPAPIPVYARVPEPRPAPIPVYARGPEPRPAPTPVYKKSKSDNNSCTIS